MKKIRFIVNPISGHHNKEKFPGLVEKYIDKSQFEYEIVLTERGGHATELAKEAISKGIDIVAAVGGDGTINETAQALIGTDTTFVIVPFGSGNGLARHLHLPLDAKKIITEVINKGETIRIDTCRLNEKPFLSIAGAGFDAAIADGFAKDPRRGFSTYFRVIVDKYFKYEPDTMLIRLDDGEAMECAPLFITFANSNQFGYNAKISPKASLTDGLIDICIFNKPKIISLPRLGTLLMTGHIDLAKKTLKILKAKKVSVSRKEDAVVNIDGEPIMTDKDFTIEVIPSSLKLMVKHSQSYR